MRNEEASRKNQLAEEGSNAIMKIIPNISNSLLDEEEDYATPYKVQKQTEVDFTEEDVE